MKKWILTMSLMMIAALPLFAQENNGKIPDYSMKDRKEVPVEYTWKIEDIYANLDAWKADKVVVTGMVEKIVVLGKDWTSSASKMYDFLKLTDDISLKGEKLYSYASLQSAMDMGNTELQSMKGEISAFFVDFSSKLSFVNDDILKLGEEKFKTYLATEPRLKPYEFNIASVFHVKDHILPSDQQKIVSLTGLFSEATSDASSMLNNVELPPVEVTLSDGSKVSLNIANYMKYRGSKNPADRSLVMHAFWENHKKFENTFAVLINGEMKQHYFSALAYNYKTSLDASLYGNDINTKVYTNLIESVHNHLGSLHKYLNLKKELLGLEKFKYDDIYASCVKSVTKTYTYDEAVKLIVDAMQPLGDDYVSVLKKGFSERWVDIYPNQGKESGAFSSGVYGVHPYVKMNYNGEYDAVSTLAHELGHSLHSYFSSKTQPYCTNNYTTFLAEIASTFNENMLMHQLLKTETDDMLKLYLLDRYLDGVRGTIFRQTLFAEFELAMHTEVEQGQTLTADWLNEKYLGLTRLYYGNDKGVCQVDDYIQDEWSYIPHFYMNYYVYQYATGIIASMALSEKVLAGEAGAKDKYITLLSSGANDYPLNILKKAGVDMTQPTSMDAAFANFDNLVLEMEKIVERLKKAGKL